MKRPSAEDGARVSLTVDPRDNVATLLDAAADRTQAAGVAIPAGVPFGHKIALTPIPRGGAVIKYGVEIGRATTDIAAGEHVHVHNIA